jgi:ubiquinone/menaquinone biosynthesis C-methylase UbiE
MTFSNDDVACTRCNWIGEVKGTIVSSLEESRSTRFDNLHATFAAHNSDLGTWRHCYEQQCEAIATAFAPGRVTLDLGCGPGAPYVKPAGAFVVGVDPSLPSLVANRDIDLGLHATAAKLPLADQSVDAVIAIYVLHHMVGETISATRANVVAAFAEMARVVKPGGDVLVLEVCPWPLTWIAERVAWTLIRRIVGPPIDFLFWPPSELVAMGRAAFPGAHLEQRRYRMAWMQTFPPVIALPWLKVPRFLYPFDPWVFRWRTEGHA